jgi:heat shock protein HtpX
MLIAFDEVRRNKFRSYLLIFFFIILIATLGTIIGYFYGNLYFGLGLAILFAIIYTIIVFFSGDKMILGLSSAKPVTKKEYPHLYHTVEGLALAANIPTPKSYVIEDKAMNAFATGRDPKNSAIVVTTGLLENMNRQELEGVIAHEMSHIKNYDIRTMMLAVVLVGIIALLSHFLLRSFLWGGGNRSRDRGQLQIILVVVGLVLAILTPLIAQLVKLAISRRREYMADASGAILTRYPPGLASALKKIENDSHQLKSASGATAHLYISNPIKKSSFSSLFSTHPPINERIKRLESM